MMEYFSYKLEVQVLQKTCAGTNNNGHGNGMEEPIKLANDTQYGLGVSIWSQDFEKAEKLSRLVSSGIVSVNNAVAADSRVPFGDI
jgi:Aldehyde dehydrogenase family